MALILIIIIITILITINLQNYFAIKSNPTMAVFYNNSLGNIYSILDVFVVGLAIILRSQIFGDFFKVNQEYI
jgi:hypothetical protein